MFKAKKTDSTLNSSWCFGYGFVFDDLGRAFFDLVANLGTAFLLALLDFILQVSDVFRTKKRDE